jgi:hypothetical protein
VQASGGVWGGCVYDVDEIVQQLQRGANATQAEQGDRNA